MKQQTKEILEKQLIVHEGIRLKPYRDTVGKLTIGVGRNLDDVGINFGEAMFLLNADIEKAAAAAAKHINNFSELSENRQAALVNMAFNLGERGLSLFLKMIDAIQAGDFELAAQEMLESRWANQVGNRAKDLAMLMRTG